MDRHVLLLVFSLTLFVYSVRGENVSQNKPTMPQSQYYELNKQKLTQLWQMAVARGIIKATARHYFKDVSHTEQKVFEQCEKGATSVIALAKCAVQIFDQRDFNAKDTKKKVQEEKKATKGSFPIRINIRKRPLYRKRITLRRNPIRSQIRTQRVPRSADAVQDAYEKFLEEERRKRKEELQREKDRRRQMQGLLGEIGDAPKTEEIVRTQERNLYGLPRVLETKKSKRTRRDVREILLKYLQQLKGEDSDLTNVRRLRRIRDYFERTGKCNGYFKLINEENMRLFEELGLPIESRPPRIEDKFVELNRVIDLINSFTNSSSSFKLLSPRILSLFPESSSSSGRLLSPTILSFHNDGFFSLPQLFDIATSNHRYRQLLLEAVMDISGAGSVLQELLTKIEPKIKEMEEHQYPWVQKMSKVDRDWLRARETFDDEQEVQFRDGQLVFLNETQLEYIYGRVDEEMRNISRMSRENKLKRIENDIRQLADTQTVKWPTWEGIWRSKRQAEEAGEGHGEEHEEKHEEHGVPEHEEININGVEVKLVTLKPYAFANLINLGIAMEAVTLSPHAFILELFRPEALQLSTLSPRAFIATILSPSALVARILSPTAFRAEVLSPRALTAWVLSPEAFLTEILTPRFLEPRVLSPEALLINVLSPAFLAPNILSNEALGILVLSPNILSPRIASEEKLLIEILSPHLLGGQHSEEEETHEVLEVGSKSETDHEEKGHVHEGKDFGQPHRNTHSNAHSHQLQSIFFH